MLFPTIFALERYIFKILFFQKNNNLDRFAINTDKAGQ